MQNVVYYVLVGVALLASVVSALIQFFKNKRNKNNSNTNGKNTANDSKSFAEILRDKIMEYTSLAESTYEKLKGSMSKSELANMKLQEVLKSLKLDCLLESMPYDEETLKAEIEKYIAYTKQVNV